MSRELGVAETEAVSFKSKVSATAAVPSARMLLVVLKSVVKWSREVDDVFPSQCELLASPIVSTCNFLITPVTKRLTFASCSSQRQRQTHKENLSAVHGTFLR